MKPITLILCVIAILGSAASTFFFFQIGDAKELLQQEIAMAATQSTELNTKLTEAAAQSSALQKRLAELDSDLGEAKSKASAADGRNTQMGRELTLLRTQFTTQTESAQALTGEIAQLKRELAQLKLSASANESALSDNHKTEIAVLEARITDLIASTAKPNAHRGLNAGASLAADGSATMSEENGTSYQVVSIGANNAFVVINAGAANGILAQQNLAINSNGKVIAAAVISSSQENYSIAQIVPHSLKGKLSKGDLATFAQ